MPPRPAIFLKRHADYRKAYDAAARGRTPLMGWFAAMRAPEGTGDGPNLRVGLTVPKAIGKAVERNRIKRRMREAIVRAAWPEIIATPVDIILHPRRTTLTTEWPPLVEDVRRALHDGLAAAKKRRA